MLPRNIERKEWIRPALKPSLALLILAMVTLIVTREFWFMRIGQSLICTEHLSRSDLILVENFDWGYLLFEEAATLQKEGLAARVLIPVQVSNDSERANTV